MTIAVTADDEVESTATGYHRFNIALQSNDDYMALIELFKIVSKRNLLDMSATKDSARIL